MPNWIKAVGRFLWEYVFAILAVLGLVSLAVWAVEVLGETKHHPVKYWLVVALAVLLAAAILWGARRRRSDGGGTTHIHQYAPGMTVNFGATGTVNASDAQPQQPASTRGAPIGGPSAKRRAVISLLDHIEYPPDGGPVIRDKHFQYAVLRGPVVLVGRDSTWIDTGFRAASPDAPWSMFFPIPEGPRIGVVLMENCLVEGCITEHVGFAGTPQDLTRIIEQIGGGPAPLMPPWGDEPDGPSHP